MMSQVTVSLPPAGTPHLPLLTLNLALPQVVWAFDSEPVNSYSLALLTLTLYIATKCIWKMTKTVKNSVILSHWPSLKCPCNFAFLIINSINVAIYVFSVRWMTHHGCRDKNNSRGTSYLHPNTIILPSPTVKWMMLSSMSNPSVPNTPMAGEKPWWKAQPRT